MSKVKPTTKEQLIHYLLSHISLGTYDRRFLSNLETGFLGKGKPITTNQASLLDKIVSRYARQISKNELNYKDLIALEWSKPLVESAPEYTTAYAELVDNKIVIRTPYKAGFIKELRAVRTAKWLKDEREWHINYNERNLKLVIFLVAEHYETINFCETIKGFLAEAERYESAKIWNPTLCKANDRLIVASINEPLADAINNIEIELTPQCLAKLSSHGIEISDDLMTDDLLKFAGSNNTKIEKSELHKLIDYLPAIGCESVVLQSSVSHGLNEPYVGLIKRLEEKNIKVYSKGRIDSGLLSDYVVLYSLRIPVSDIESHATKLIQVVNSEPVDIK